jgi:hypothetical protein
MSQEPYLNPIRTRSGGCARLTWVFSLLPVATLGACGNHDSILIGPDKPLAIGAYHSLSFGDACVATGGKDPSFCTTEVVTQLLESRSDDASIAEVVPASEHPMADRAAHEFYVLGKGAGQTSVVFKGMFDDGSVRESRIAVRVEPPDTFEISDCRRPGSSNLLVSVGDTDTFELQMSSRGQQLSGWLPGAVTADGLADAFMDSDAMPYEWQAPATPGVVDVQSSILPNLPLTLTAFGPAQVTGIDLEPAFSPSREAFTQPGVFEVATKVHVQGQAPCRPQTVEVHSTTPSICSGTSGESTWQMDSGTGLVAVHAEGSCVLEASVPAGQVLSTQTFPIFFVQPEPPDPNAGSDVCLVEGATLCNADSYAVLVCKKNAWTTASLCAADQACDYVPDTTRGCVAGSPCARCRGLR